MAMVLLFLLVITLLAASGLFAYLSVQEARMPKRTPAWLLKGATLSPETKVVVCVGDGITQGTVSYDFVEWLQARLSGACCCVNAGKNGDMAWHVARRLHEVIACRPDYVMLLIGTGDALSHTGKAAARSAQREHGLPELPTLETFGRTLHQICDRLQSETAARIALSSIPPIGERFGTRAYRCSLAVTETIRSVAMARGLVYLPLHEKMVDYLKRRKRLKKPMRYSDRVARIAAFRARVDQFVLNRRLDDISASNRFYLLTDFIHLNSRAAGMVVDLAAAFVRQSGAGPAGARTPHEGDAHALRNRPAVSS